jgi:hypothetical protein
MNARPKNASSVFTIAFLFALIGMSLSRCATSTSPTGAQGTQSQPPTVAAQRIVFGGFTQPALKPGSRVPLPVQTNNLPAGTIDVVVDTIPVASSMAWLFKLPPGDGSAQALSNCLLTVPWTSAACAGAETSDITETSHKVLRVPFTDSDVKAQNGFQLVVMNNSLVTYDVRFECGLTPGVTAVVGTSQ